MKHDWKYKDRYFRSYVDYCLHCGATRQVICRPC